jgi:hypothetical protein
VRGSIWFDRDYRNYRLRRCLQFTDEPIPSFGNCLDVARLFGAIVQRLPQLANRHPEATVKINERIVGPEAASKFLPTDYFSGIFEERDQEPMRELLQPDAFPVLQEFSRAGVYLKRAELVNNSALCLHSGHLKP